MPHRFNNTFSLKNGPALAGRALVLLLALMLTAEAALAASLSEKRAERRAARAEATAQEKETPLTPETFNHTATLDGQAGSVLSYTLPEAVHKGLESTAFRDLCVFDANGIPVPFQLRAPEGTNERLEVEKDVPHFLWQPEKFGANAPDSMDIEISATGAIVSIKGRAGEPARSGPVSYLLDMQAFLDVLEAPPASGGGAFIAADIRERALVARLGGDESFMASVSMQVSDDLSNWRRAGKPQMLIRTRQGDIEMERNTITLPEPAGRYLLLHFPEGGIPVSSFSARAVFDKMTFEMKETIVPGTLAENRKMVSYRLPGRFPLTAIGFDLPQADMMAVRLTGADDPERPYAQYATGFIYRLEKDGVTLTGEPFPVTASRHYWNLHAAGDIPFASAPGMRVIWQPRELLFLARGDGPWTLAYGRRKAVEASTLPMLTGSDARPAREIAFATTEIGAGVPPAEKGEGREWLLWAVLVLAVVFLLGVAVWLARSMKK